MAKINARATCGSVDQANKKTEYQHQPAAKPGLTSVQRQSAQRTVLLNTYQSLLSAAELLQQHALFGGASEIGTDGQTRVLRHAALF